MIHIVDKDVINIPNEIIEKLSDRSLFSKLFMYLNICVSEWYELKLGCVMKGVDRLMSLGKLTPFDVLPSASGATPNAAMKRKRWKIRQEKLNNRSRSKSGGKEEKQKQKATEGGVGKKKRLVGLK